MAQALEDTPMETIHRPQGATVRAEPVERRIRGVLAGQTVVDTTGALLVFEQGHLPIYYLPLADVRSDFLVASEKRTTCPRKGEAGYHSLQVGDREVPDAVWGYPEPIEGCPDISEHVAFYWDALDSWWEEDDEVFVHPRDPYHRVDVLRSSRHVVVKIRGEVVAESRRPLILYETGLPARYYLPRADVRADVLRPSERTSACPYKGTAGYLSVDVGGELEEDVAWSYAAPIPECPKVEQAICFFNERVDLEVDGEQLERPNTPWSKNAGHGRRA